MKDLVNQKGFTLVEVLIAITIFALGILTMNRVQMAAISTNSSANEITYVTKIMQDRIESLLTMNYDAIDDSNGNGTNTDNDSNGIDDKGTGYMFGLNDTGEGVADDFDEVTGPLNKKYLVSYNVAVDQPIKGNKTIRTIIQWTDKRSINHSIAMDCVKGINY